MRVTNSQVAAHKNLIFRILVEAISIAYTSLQQRQSIFLSLRFCNVYISEAATGGVLLKKVFLPWHRCFPVHLAKFLRTTFLQKTSGRLLLAFTPIEISCLEAVAQRCSLQLCCAFNKVICVYQISVISLLIA